MFCGTDDNHCRSNRLHGILQNIHVSLIHVIFGHLTDLCIVGKYQLLNLWNILPADILLTGENYAWRTTLKQAEHYVLYEYD